MSCECSLNDADFTFLWEIKYITLWNELKQDTITSATFCADSLYGTRWELCLKRNPEDQSFDLLLKRAEKDDGPEEMDIKITFEVSNKTNLLKTLRIPLIIKATRNVICGLPSILKQDEIVNKSSVSSPDNYLTIYCFLKRCANNMIQVCRSTTEVDLERVSFIWKTSILAENFEGVSVSVQRLVRRAPPLDIFLFSEMNDGDRILNFSFDGQEMFECERKLTVICKITLLNDGEKAGLSLQSRHSFKSADDAIWHFPLFFNVSDLEEKLLECLTFCFDLQFSYGKLTSKIEETKYIPHNISQDAKCLHFENFYPLYSQGLFFDVELLVENELFPAHKDVLCVRSPIFRNKIAEDPDATEIRITNLDGETLDNFLKCLYSSLSLEQMQPYFSSLLQYNWTNFKKLYAAADKYEVAKLKDLCSTILVSNINSKNVIECLQLAELYKDYSLKDAARNYFSAYAREIINGNAFKELLNLNQR